jgi:hypothetical protein
MASKRRFYRTVVRIEILSEEPYHGNTLSAINYDIKEEGCSGLLSHVVRNEEHDGPSIARLLMAQGSGPEFFRLTATGEDIENEDVA